MSVNLSPVRVTTGPRRRPSLANAAIKCAPAPPRILIHGVGGVGKTSFAANMPNPIFLQSPGETGLETLIGAGQAADLPIFRFDVCDERGNPVMEGGSPKLTTQVPTWQDVDAAIDSLLHEDHEFKTLVVDVMNGLERLLYEFVCQSDFDGDWGERGFAGFQRGYDVSIPRWKEFLVKVDRLRTERGMYFVGILHSQIRTFANPVGPDYDRWETVMHKKLWSLTFGWSDICLFFNQEVFAEKKSKGASKAKANTGRRLMHTTQTAAWDAKHRHGIPEVIDMGSSGKEAFGNLCAEMRKARDAGLAAINPKPAKPASGEPAPVAAA